MYSFSDNFSLVVGYSNSIRTNVHFTYPFFRKGRKIGYQRRMPKKCLIIKTQRMSKINF